MNTEKINDPYLIETELKNMIKEVTKYYESNCIIDDKIISKSIFEEQMKSKYNYLYNSSNILFKKCLDNELNNENNLKRVEQMIGYMKQMYNGNETRTNIEKKIGQQYADEYVMPLINKNK